MNSRPAWDYRFSLYQSQRGGYQKEEHEEGKEEETACQEVDLVGLQLQLKNTKVICQLGGPSGSLCSNMLSNSFSLTKPPP